MYPMSEMCKRMSQKGIVMVRNIVNMLIINETLQYRTGFVGASIDKNFYLYHFYI